MDLAKKANELRRDILDVVYNAGAGHIGGDLSVIDILTTLYYSVMNVSSDKRDDPDRDRFILSKGHCADALYTVLADKGYFDKKELLDTFCKYQSKYIGHPNNDVPGVELSSGSLGHGLSVGVGMAIAGKMDKKSYRVYVVLGDGEMEEGSNYEAMAAAAHYHLDNLCATVDLNGLQISGATKDVMCTDSLSDKFQAFGWNVIEVNGNDCEALVNAYDTAKTVVGKPTLVLAHTVKGKGVSFMENQASWHHGVMDEEKYKIAVNDIEEVL